MNIWERFKDMLTGKTPEIPAATRAELDEVGRRLDDVCRRVGLLENERNAFREACNARHRE